ncbi:hypothetical protein Hypma_006464 [Hypsizygus marmoreus]|uniref:Uncharacterized protein n=1 Tax=Hypsizygus marmoreus TaxID=39966 RepID=A0A369K0U6_HYPMA|nr:hypothetical protein Hypma_006464 [Hypsizygus marmoreus]
MSRLRPAPSCDVLDNVDRVDSKVRFKRIISGFSPYIPGNPRFAMAHCFVDISRYPPNSINVPVKQHLGLATARSCGQLVNRALICLWTVSPPGRTNAILNPYVE